MVHHTAKAGVQGQDMKGRAVHATRHGDTIEIEAVRFGVTIQRERISADASRITTQGMLQSYCNAIAAQWGFNAREHGQDKPWRDMAAEAPPPAQGGA